jgi:hypothetical protein
VRVRSIATEWVEDEMSSAFLAWVPAVTIEEKEKKNKTMIGIEHMMVLEKMELRMSVSSPNSTNVEDKTHEMNKSMMESRALIQRKRMTRRKTS